MVTINWLSTAASGSVHNTDFEASLGTWVNDGNATLAGSVGHHHTGSWSMSMTPIATGNLSASHTGHANYATNGLAVQPGQQVVVGAWFQAGTVSRSCQMGVVFFDSHGVQAGPVVYGNPTADNTGGWTLVNDGGNIFAPFNAAWAIAEATILGANEAHFIDDAFIIALAPANIPVFPAGYGPLPTDFNNWVQFPLAFVTQGVMFRAERHGALTLNAGVNTIIPFDTILEDPYTGWNPATNTWFAPYTGIYEVTLTVVTAATSEFVTAIIFPPANFSATPVSNQVCFSDLPGGGSAQAMLPVLAGTGFRGAVNASAGSTISTTNGLYSTMEISYVSQG